MTEPREILRHADVQAVLDALKIEHVRRGDELVARCLSGRHDDRHPSWSVHSEPGAENNGLHSCWSCKWAGSLFDLVTKVRGCGFAEALEFVAQRRSTATSRELTRGYDKPFRLHEPPEIRWPRGLKEVEQGSECLLYLAGRDFGMEEVRGHGLMDWRWRGRVFVPVTRRGVLVHWVARSYRGENPRALTPTGEGLGSRWGIFNLDGLDRSQKILHLTEGWADCIRVKQAGFPNPVALCGSSMTEHQAGELTCFSEIVVWQDGDVAGEAMCRSVRGWLGQDRKVEVVSMPIGKDPADFPPDELRTFHRRRG